MRFGDAGACWRAGLRRGARLTVLPARTPAAEALALGADGVVLSNGPGDPEPLTGIVQAVSEILAAEDVARGNLPRRAFDAATELVIGLFRFGEPKKTSGL